MKEPDDATKRRWAAEDESLKAAITAELTQRLAGYDLWAKPTLMADRATGKIRGVVNFETTYEQARKLTK